MRLDYVNHELLMLQKYHHRPYSKMPINSVFVVFENKLHRDKCLFTFRMAEHARPFGLKVKNWFKSLIGLTVNEFDFGKNKDTDIHKKIFFKRYVPFKVQAPPKPEFILWQNLEFVNKKLKWS